MPLITQFTYFSKPEQKYSTPFRILPIPRQFTPTKIVNPPDAIDLPYLEVRDLDDVGHGGCEEVRPGGVAARRGRLQGGRVLIELHGLPGEQAQDEVQDLGGELGRPHPHLHSYRN